jgi:glycosyltransferase involved in cell wall biosynthesis
LRNGWAMTRRIRVAMLTSQYLSEYAMRLAVGVSQTCDVLLLSDAGMEKYCRQKSLDEVAPIVVKAYPAAKRWQYPFFVGAALWQMARFRPDILHCQQSSARYHLIVVWVMHFFVPVVLTIHDPNPHSGDDTVRYMKRDTLFIRQRRLASLIMTNGEYCYRDFLRSAEPELRGRVAVTRHGVIMVPAPEQRHAPVPNSMIFLGRMEKYKGLEVLIAAMGKLAEKSVAVTLTIAGRGSELDRLEPTIRKFGNIEIRNRFLPPDEMIAEIQKAQLVVLPYLDATQSGVVAAAFANGRPVVASDVGGLGEVVHDGENGFLVPPGDADRLAETIAAVFQTDGLYDRLREGAAGTAGKLLDWQAIGAEVGQQYHKLLHRSEA